MESTRKDQTEQRNDSRIFAIDLKKSRWGGYIPTVLIKSNKIHILVRKKNRYVLSISCWACVSFSYNMVNLGWYTTIGLATSVLHSPRYAYPYTHLLK